MKNQQMNIDFPDMEISEKVKIGIIMSKGTYTKFSENYTTILEEIIKSWNSPFDLFAKKTHDSDLILRDSQKGAIHAVIAHWTCSSKPANVVMPTGTGKTETMMSLLLIEQCEKVLIIVPTIPLRDQTFEKFLNLGILPKLKGFNSGIKFPVIGKIEKIPKTKEEINEVFDKSNVVVAIATSLGQCSETILNHIANKSSHLFVDEAHHITANQWKKVKDPFIKKKRKVLQFTATPFRNDNQPIGGRTVYNYPLKKAFDEGYFKKIHFEEIIEWDDLKSDEAIAQRAIELLRRDLGDPNKFDHILMARTRSILRAKTILDIYKKLGAEYKPKIIHSKLNWNEKNTSLEAVKSRDSRIVVCVDMLGEGFDLPNLKIAALHDLHMSLPITLQFIGRFTRSSVSSNIGDASIVANIATQTKLPEALEKLYSQDSDWNEILQYQSNAKIRKQIGLEEFIESFNKGDQEDISIQNIRPKMSTVVYKMGASTTWNPDNIQKDFGKNKDQIIKTAVSRIEKVLVIVEGKRNYIEWGNFKDIKNLIWDLYLIYWDEAKNLLFINSSNNNSLHENLAKSIGGDGATIVKGEDVFRCFYGLNRTIFQNVGLNSARGHAIRYTMYTGIDVEQGLTDAQKATKFKSNLFGIGFENGEKTSMGCSYKGRVWSRRSSTIPDFVEWCKQVGVKLLDGSIDTKEVFKNALRREIISSIPDSRAIAIEWDQEIYEGLTDNIFEIIHNGAKYNIDDIGLDIVFNELDDTNGIKFKIYNDNFESHFRLTIEPKNDNESTFVYKKESGDVIQIKVNGICYDISDYFQEKPPIIRLIDGSFLEGNILAKITEKPTYFDKEKIETWDWGALGVDIKKESQGKDKIQNSIQYKVIDHLKKDGFEIVFDDDSSGEIADVVAIKLVKERILIRLYHCKFSHDSMPGQRISDLYEVCGQAQKSIQWKSKVTELFNHLIRRANTTKVNGFEAGDQKKALLYRKQSNSFYPTDFHIYIVQPGVSKEKISEDQLKLLGSTELYLSETYQIPLKIIASD